VAYAQIGLADRTLMPGDVVRRRLPGQKDLVGQAGYVRDVNVRADVTVLGSKMVIKNVPAERLRPISEWTRDVPVCLGTWIGTTLTVDECAVLKYVEYPLIPLVNPLFNSLIHSDLVMEPVWKSPPTTSTNSRMLWPSAPARSSIPMYIFRATLLWVACRLQIASRI